jgi:hypothetical protein
MEKLCARIKKLHFHACAEDILAQRLRQTWSSIASFFPPQTNSGAPMLKRRAGPPILNADISQRRWPTQSKRQHCAPANQNNQPFAPSPQPQTILFLYFLSGYNPQHKWHSKVETYKSSGGEERAQRW